MTYHQPTPRQCNPNRHQNERTPDLCLQAIVMVRPLQAELQFENVRTSRPTPLNPTAPSFVLPSTAAFSTPLPPTTLPVKETKLTSGCAAAYCVCCGVRWSVCEERESESRISREIGLKRAKRLMVGRIKAPSSLRKTSSSLVVQTDPRRQGKRSEHTPAQRPWVHLLSPVRQRSAPRSMASEEKA